MRHALSRGQPVAQRDRLARLALVGPLAPEYGPEHSPPGLLGRAAVDHGVRAEEVGQAVEQLVKAFVSQHGLLSCRVSTSGMLVGKTSVGKTSHPVMVKFSISLPAGRTNPSIQLIVLQCGQRKRNSPPPLVI